MHHPKKALSRNLYILWLPGTARPLQCFFKQRPRDRRGKMSFKLVTTEGNKMKIARELISLQALRHAVDCSPVIKNCKKP